MITTHIVINKNDEQQDTDNTKYVDINDIDSIVDNTCSMLTIKNVVRFIPESDAKTLLNKCISKLRKDGTLIINDIDIMEVARSVYLSMMNMTEFNKMISNAVFLHSLYDIIIILGSVTKVVSKNIDDYYYNIEVKKP